MAALHWSRGDEVEQPTGETAIGRIQAFDDEF